MILRFFFSYYFTLNNFKKNLKVGPRSFQILASPLGLGLGLGLRGSMTVGGWLLPLWTLIRMPAVSGP